MVNVRLDKRTMKLVSTALMIALFLLLILAFGAYQSVALAAPDSADPLAPNSDLALQGYYYPPPAPAAPVIVTAPEKRCKLIVKPSVVTLGEPFEVCWLGNKHADLKVGPAIIAPDGPEYYTKENGKGLVCHMYTINPGEVLPGTVDFRCIGEDGTISGDYFEDR